MDLVQRYQLAQHYLDDGTPLAALETPRPIEAELTDTAKQPPPAGNEMIFSWRVPRWRSCYSSVAPS